MAPLSSCNSTASLSGVELREASEVDTQDFMDVDETKDVGQEHNIHELTLDSDLLNDPLLSERPVEIDRNGKGKLCFQRVKKMQRQGLPSQIDKGTVDPDRMHSSWLELKHKVRTLRLSTSLQMEEDQNALPSTRMIHRPKSETACWKDMYDHLPVL
mmetsp:Transcript_1740/g.3261  ORF Transcript_1740/g.3261 Transcript_1740/m.3261 type:complete len:157 (-) Transcript_1740:141-611(-)